MRIRYTVPLKRKIIIDDHWTVPFQGGTLLVIEEDGCAKALELTFEKQPLEYAPHLRHHDNGETAATIIGRDHRMKFVKRQLDNAATFLECIHDIELSTDEIRAEYIGETPEEESEIGIKSILMERHTPALSLSFDILTRAIMAAEKQDGPKFEATLSASARKALARQEFINSFRYSFLLIESFFGEGQFKKAGLQSTLKANQDFREIVESALKDAIPTKDRLSETAKLLASKPSLEEVIDHLVEKRGYYFHGNVKRKDAWTPSEQGGAEALAFLAQGIVTIISMKAARLMFAPEFEKRHLENAIQIGAKIVFNLKFKFREPEEKFDRDNEFNITMPGTKVTPRAALEVAQFFLKKFEEVQPFSFLREAECTVQGGRQKVFSLKFHTAEDEAKNN